MKKIIILSLLLGLLLGACASAQPTGLSSKSLPGTSTPNSASLPPDVVIEYTQSGGITGKTETWLIYADGRVTGPGGAEAKLEPAFVNRLVAEFDAIGLADFPLPISPENNTCNDCLTYQVIVRSNGEVKTFTAQDAQPDVPESFWTALKDLQQIFMPQPK